MEKRYDAIVVGAGPAGMFCAIHAAVCGCHVLLLEKNAVPGAKLLLAGCGQCNLTHDGDVRDFIARYGDHGKFLRPALLALPNWQLMDFFTSRGLAMETERNGKVFSATRRSADVLAVLLAECSKQGVSLKCGGPVTTIARSDEGFTVTTPLGSVSGTFVVITTGGASYPQCGTTGDGYRIASLLGQPVTDTSPALTPLIIQQFPFGALSGISFKTVPFSLWRDGRKIRSCCGDILFTRRGLSGPGILDASRWILPGDVVKVSFIGRIQRNVLTADLVKRTAEHPSCHIGTILSCYPLPERLIKNLLRLSGIPDNLTCAHFSAAQRSVLAANCTEFPLVVDALEGYSVAMVTRGGIALDGVDPKTMESKFVPGLFFAGEVLDIDGDTGGYNLQAAFSTGFLAAQGIRKRQGK